MAAAEALLLEIARCSNVRRGLESQFLGHPCAAVVAAQPVAPDELHVPEPWNGDIERAPLLFVSWNPSWNPAERFPTSGWVDPDIVEFFQQRFEHTDQSSQTWRETRGIAEHLLGYPPQPGHDYAVTDIVRCKSPNGIGASEAVSECAARYLRRTLDVAGARVVVALGRDARAALASHFGSPTHLGACGPYGRAGSERTLVLLGAPGSAQPRRLANDDLERVRDALHQGQVAGDPEP